MAEVARQTHGTNARVAGGEVADQFPGAVTAAVIHQQELAVAAMLQGQPVAQLGQRIAQEGKHVFLVEAGHNQGNQRSDGCFSHAALCKQAPDWSRRNGSKYTGISQFPEKLVLESRAGQRAEGAVAAIPRSCLWQVSNPPKIIKFG